MNKILSKVIGIGVIGSIAFSFLAPLAEARELGVGTRGNDVSALQTWLIGNGFTIPFIENGKASKGYFGEQTKNAVMMYQESLNEPEDGYIDSNAPLATPEPKLGASAGPEIEFPYLRINGVRTWYYSIPFIASTGTTTLCSIKLPQATTTYTAAFNVTALASTTDMEIGTDTINAGTSTRLAHLNQLPTGGGFLYVSSATTTAMSLVGSVSTTTYRYLNFKIGTAPITGATPTVSGVCKATLTEVDNFVN